MKREELNHAKRFLIKHANDLRKPGGKVDAQRGRMYSAGMYAAVALALAGAIQYEFGPDNDGE